MATDTHRDTDGICIENWFCDMMNSLDGQFIIVWRIFWLKWKTTFVLLRISSEFKFNGMYCACVWVPDPMQETFMYIYIYILLPFGTSHMRFSWGQFGLWSQHIYIECWCAIVHFCSCMAINLKYTWKSLIWSNTQSERANDRVRERERERSTTSLDNLNHFPSLPHTTIANTYCVCVCVPNTIRNFIVDTNWYDLMANTKSMHDWNEFNSLFCRFVIVLHCCCYCFIDIKDNGNEFWRQTKLNDCLCQEKLIFG